METKIYTTEPETYVESSSAMTTENVTPAPESGSSVSAVMCTFLTLYSICIVLIVVGNALVIATILKSRSLRQNTSNLLLLSLVTARLSIGLFVVPAEISGMFSEVYLGTILCKSCQFVALTSAVASVASIASIALIKYYTIVLHNAEITITRKVCGVTIACVWIGSLVFAIRAPIVTDIVLIQFDQSSMHICTVHPDFTYIDKYFTIVDFIILFFLPMVVILSCNSQVMHKLKLLSKEKDTASAAESKRMIKMMAILITLFIICTSPPLILKLYIQWGPGYFVNANTIGTALRLVSFSNAWINLIVFMKFRKDLWEALKRMFRKDRVRPVKAVQVTGDSEITNQRNNNYVHDGILNDKIFV